MFAWEEGGGHADPPIEFGPVIFQWLEQLPDDAMLSVYEGSDPESQSAGSRSRRSSVDNSSQSSAPHVTSGRGGGGSPEREAYGTSLERGGSGAPGGSVSSMKAPTDALLSLDQYELSSSFGKYEVPSGLGTGAGGASSSGKRRSAAGGPEIRAAP